MTCKAELCIWWAGENWCTCEFLDIEPEESRPYMTGSGGRVDVEGVVWYACDPYPTWYRWEGSELITAEPDFEDDDE